MCRGEPADGESPGPVSDPYSHANRDVRLNGCTSCPSAYRSSVALCPPPPGASGIEYRSTNVFDASRDVHDTESPVPFNVTARRPVASPAMSPMVRFGPTAAADPPRVPSVDL